jgi:hypothetical protein
MISDVYETTGLRVGLALWVGAVVGTCLSVLAMVASTVVYSPQSGPVESFVSLVALTAVVLFMCFSVGLLLLRPQLGGYSTAWGGVVGLTLYSWVSSSRSSAPFSCSRKITCGPLRAATFTPATVVAPP